MKAGDVFMCCSFWETKCKCWLIVCRLLFVQVTSLKLITICIDLTNSECVSMFVVISERLIDTLI